MKSSPASSGSYYFQGYKGTFITGCPDSDKQFKHHWFYAGGWWLHGHLPYDEVSLEESVPTTFRLGYVWTRGRHTGVTNLDNIDVLQETSDPERNQNRLLSSKSLAKYKWVGPSSSSNNSPDRPRVRVPGEVTVASRMPDSVVCYHAQTVVATDIATTSGRSEIPQGLPVAPTHVPPSGNSSSESWGPRIADEDMDLLLRQLYSERGLQIEGRLVFQVFFWSVRPCTNPLFFCRANG